MIYWWQACDIRNDILMTSMRYKNQQYHKSDIYLHKYEAIYDWIMW
jgi:hypothetical protein